MWFLPQSEFNEVSEIDIIGYQADFHKPDGYVRTVPGTTEYHGVPPGSIHFQHAALPKDIRYVTRGTGTVGRKAINQPFTLILFPFVPKPNRYSKLFMVISWISLSDLILFCWRTT